VADERNHSNLQSTTSAPTGLLDSSILPASSIISKTVEDQSIDDDPVNNLKKQLHYLDTALWQ
jgi:hypothetical protein